MRSGNLEFHNRRLSGSPRSVIVLHQSYHIARRPSRRSEDMTTPQKPQHPSLPDGPGIERQLLPLQHIPVAPAALPRPARNDRIQPAGLELPLQARLHLAHLLEPLLLLFLHAVALLGGLVGGLALGAGALLPPPQRLPVVRLVPLAEGRGVDLDDGGLGQGVCAHELVVGRVEGDGDDADLARDALAAPREVAAVEAQAAVLGVAAAHADGVDALGPDAGRGGLAALFEGSVGVVSVRLIERGAMEGHEVCV